jgi:hypothetical protein
LNIDHSGICHKKYNKPCKEAVFCRLHKKLTIVGSESISQLCTCAIAVIKYLASTRLNLT